VASPLPAGGCMGSFGRAPSRETGFAIPGHEVGDGGACLGASIPLPPSGDWFPYVRRMGGPRLAFAVVLPLSLVSSGCCSAGADTFQRPRWPAERAGPSAAASGHGRHFPVLCPSASFSRPTRRPLLACSVAQAVGHVTLLQTGSAAGPQWVAAGRCLVKPKRHLLPVSCRKGEICYDEACHIHASKAPHDAAIGPCGLSGPNDGAPKAAAAAHRRPVWSRVPRIGTTAILRRF